MTSGASGYCRKNELSAVGISIALEVENDPESKLMSKLTYTFSFPEGFPEEHRQAILANAANCYVKRHLYTPPEVIVQ